MEDDNSSVEDEVESQSISEASDTPAGEKEELKEPIETSQKDIAKPAEKAVEIVEENIPAENTEVIENVIENNSNAQLKENIEQAADDSKKVEDIIINSNKESVNSDVPAKKIEERSTVVLENERVNKVSTDKVDKVDKVEIVEEKPKPTEIPTTKTVNNTSTVENFEKRIENLNISSVSENRILEETDIRNFKEKEKGIVEIRKIEKTEEKENKLYVVSSIKKLKIDINIRRAH